MKLNKTWLFTTYLLLFVFLVSGGVLFNSCNGKKAGDAFKPTGDTIADGKALTQQYCASCHKLVPPDLLTKNVWKFHILPDMSHYLGLSSYSIVNYYKDAKDTGGISVANWEIIAGYYNKVAPDSLVAAKTPVPLSNDWAGFTLKKPDTTKDIDYTTLLQVDPATQKMYTADIGALKFFEWDKQFRPHPVADLPSTAVSATFVNDEKGNRRAILSCIGQIIPMDFPNGRIMAVDLNAKEEVKKPQLVQEDLARPVQTVQADFNKDGLTDYVVLAQGRYVGGVYLMKQNADHSYTQSNISDKPGAAQAITADFNNDGWPDLMILYGGGDEGLWLYLNDKKGGFTSRNLLRFPPVYGSTSFQLADINHDGKPDLVYTCGYNYKDSRILKPYHGLYIFTNEGDWNFKQTYFYPINGCTKAIAADFDGDGDLDIATIAFFADMKNKPAEEFIYFEQDGPMSFKPHAVPVSKYGRWMCMEVADMNGDGKPDILLGNYGAGFMFQRGYKPFWNTHLPFILLQNNFKK
ncbi:MAG: VCBS repeat-containing protein [Bacteroidetes bacterium]|nr:VCBS repeat-containing protein [Bacteroidota bacterium]